MSYLDIEPGKYTAQAISMKAGKSALKQTPYIEIEFAIPFLNEKLRYKGYLTEKTQDRTLDITDMIEWNGDPRFNPGSFSTTKEVELVVERETGSDGVERPRIRYVNDPSSPRASAVENDESALSGLNLKAMMAARKAASKAQTPPPDFKMDTEEELGF